MQFINTNVSYRITVPIIAKQKLKYIFSKPAKDSNDNIKKKNDTMRKSTFYTTIDTLSGNRHFPMSFQRR